MTSSPTPPTPPSFFLAFPHLPLPSFFSFLSPLFFFLPCRPFPDPCRRFPKIFRRFSPPIRSQDLCDVNFGKLGLKGPMRQHDEIFGPIFRNDVIAFADQDSQQPIRSQGFGAKIWINQSQATISNRQKWSKGFHSTTLVKFTMDKLYHVFKQSCLLTDYQCVWTGKNFTIKNKRKV